MTTGVPYTVTFPSFRWTTASHATCPAVTQALSNYVFPSDVATTINVTEDNQLTFNSIDLSADIGTFSVQYDTTFDDQSRTLTLTFDVTLCEYETVHD
jgi:hypothetical protein